MRSDAEHVDRITAIWCASGLLRPFAMVLTTASAGRGVSLAIRRTDGSSNDLLVPLSIVCGRTAAGAGSRLVRENGGEMSSMRRLGCPVSR
jgi:hypothetical protein